MTVYNISHIVARFQHKGQTWVRIRWEGQSYLRDSLMPELDLRKEEEKELTGKKLIATGTNSVLTSAGNELRRPSSVMSQVST